MRRKFYLLTLLLCLAATPVVLAEPGAPDHNTDDLNVINRVAVDHGDTGTTITIAGSMQPTYSVFKLQAPMRLFVDISNSSLEQSVKRGPTPVDDGVITQVAVLDFSDEVQEVTRVIVGFERLTKYDVRTEGDKVVIFVEGSGRPADSGARVDNSRFQRELEQREGDLELARTALREKERRISESEQKVLALEKALAEAKGSSRKVLKSAVVNEKKHATDLRAELVGRERQVDKLQRSLEALEARLGDIRSERDAASSKASQLSRKLKNEQTQVSALHQQLVELRKSKSKSEVRAAQLKKERDEAKQLAITLGKERDSAKKKANKLDRDASKAKSRLKKTETELATATSTLAKVREARRKAVDGASSLRGEIASLRQRLGNQDLDADKTRRQLRDVEEQLARKRGAASANDAAMAAQIAKLERTQRAKKDQLATLEKRLLTVSKQIEGKERSLDRSIAEARRLESVKDKAETAAQLAEQRRRQQEAKTAEANAATRDAAERARTREEQRLRALKTAREKEEARLAAVAKSRKLEERRLAKAREATATQQRASKLERQRLAEIKRERAAEEKAKSAASAKLKRTERAQKAQEQARRKEEARLQEARRQRQGEEARIAEAKADSAQIERDNAAASERAAKVKADSERLERANALARDRVAELKKVAAESPTAQGDILNTVRSIRFQQSDEISRVVVEMARPADFRTVPWTSGKASLVLTSVALPTNLERSLDTRAFGGTVHFVNSFQDKDGLVHVEAEVPTATTEMVRQEGAKLVWEFSSVGNAAPEASPSAPTPTPALPRPAGFTSAPPKFAPSARRAGKSRVPPWQRRPTGMARKRLNVDMRAADIQNVLRIFAREGGVNIVSGSGVGGTVTMRLENVPIADAFVVVLKSVGLGYEQDNEVIRVAPASEFEAAAKKRRDLIMSNFKLDPLEVVLIPINYADAGSVTEQVQSVMSSRGSVTVDSRTNTLVIKDIAENIAAAQQLVMAIDTQTPQILIESRIVETNDRYSRQIGIQWGGDFLFSPANGNPTGLAFPSVVGVAGAANDGQGPTQGLAGNPNFAVNLPAPIGTGAGGGFGVTLGSVGGAASLAVRLSALESSGHIKIVSSPRVLTLDNRAASISQGTSIPISVVSAAGVQTVFIEAALKLDVTPHVTQDGNILLQLKITKSEPDFENTGARGDPTIIKKDAKTELLLADGDTTVIGGIYTQQSGTSSSKVPWLGDIPVLGFFFRDYNENEGRTELLIFVTPRIVNREAALASRRLSPIAAPVADDPK